MRKTILIVLLLFSLEYSGYTQIQYKRKIEVGYSKYIAKTVQTVHVDQNADWKGTNLDKQQNGIDISFVNGLKLNERFYIGLGIGYLNFEGINGYTITSDFEVLPFKTKLTPLLNLKIGYSHIWNQYENGTGTPLVELCTGLNYKLTDKLGLFMQIGFVLTQQSLLRPIRIGLKF